MIPRTCRPCIYLLTVTDEDESGRVQGREAFCNYGQARKLDALVPVPEWCPNGGLPDLGMTEEEWEAREAGQR